MNEYALVMVPLHLHHIRHSQQAFHILNTEHLYFHCLCITWLAKVQLKIRQKYNMTNACSDCRTHPPRRWWCSHHQIYQVVTSFGLLIVSCPICLDL